MLRHYKEGTMNRAPTKSTALRRRWAAARGRFGGLRREEPRTGTENLTVWPVFFVKENLAFARVAVEPARDEGQVFAEFFATGGHGWRGGLLRDLPRCCCGFFHALRGRRAAFEIVLEDMFGGARLAGDFGETQKE